MKKKPCKTKLLLEHLRGDILIIKETLRVKPTVTFSFVEGRLHQG